MRTILILVGVAALVLLAAMMTGFVNIDQTRQAALPRLEGGQAPKFEAEVGRIDIGTENRTIAVPKVEVQRPAEAE
jgi:hypothetical protein